MDYGIHGQTAIIFGGARGIGYAAAAMLAGEGAQVAIADLNAEAAVDSARRLAEKTGVKTVGVAADVTSLKDVRRGIDELESTLGTADVVINSAAIVDDKLFMDSNDDDWRRMIDVCLYGPMNILHVVLPGMRERRYGRVICLASDSARIGQARLSYYAAAKAGVIALVKSVAQEVGRDGITLNVVSPGATNTELRLERETHLREQMGEEKYARREKNVLRLYPTGRIGEPDDIAAAVAFLSSRGASWITGQVLSVNGGFVMP